MNRLTIFFSNSKTTQVINLSASFVLNQKGFRLSYGEMYEKAKTIAHDITCGNYLSFDLDVMRNQE